MDRIVEELGRKNNCTFCGVFRRQALDRGAVLLGKFFQCLLDAHLDIRSRPNCYWTQCRRYCGNSLDEQYANLQVLYLID